ncbi:YajQ family cyclic di-GMP-binding protein [Candidatus Marinamargulisbacteria bacterium SCGC AAA071-K20]|nr:YajQ family cyclic di-GMP-binding protein [Candidatus Marinamargulisbacteria bacterium SCGC AAA071-K20]
MMADNSFDIVSEIDLQELDNAINQALKEISNRYDLKDSDTEIKFNEKELTLNFESSDDYKLKAAKEIFIQKAIKRSISPKAFKDGTVEPASSGRAREELTIQQGISKENAKIITKAIKDSKLKVNTQIQGEQVRVQGKKLDELQAVMQMLKEMNLEFPLNFVNYR